MKCKFCERSTESTDGKSRKRCNSCNTKIRRTRNKIAAIFYLGGNCNSCSLQANKDNLACFEFHHRDPAEKDFQIGRVANKSWHSIVNELDKCELLCSNCHKQKHSTRFDSDILKEALQYTGPNEQIEDGIRNLSDNGNTSG